MLSGLGCVWLWGTLWTVIWQGPLSLGLSKQEYWNRLPCPLPGDRLNPGIKPVSLMSPASVGQFLTTSATWEARSIFYRTDFWTLWEKARVGCFKRTASKHVYYQGWNRSPAQVGCMRQVLGAGALGGPRGIGWRGRWEGGLGWGIHVNPWLIHVKVWQNPLQYCKVISLQLIKINGKKIKDDPRKC